MIGLLRESVNDLVSEWIFERGDECVSDEMREDLNQYVSE